MKRLRLGAGAIALVLAASLAACGSSDSSSDTTSASSSTAATQAATTATETTATTASNGIADKPADEILAAAKTAASAASAVHVAGKADGLELDLSLVRGKGASGELAQGSNRFELITLGDDIYLRGSDDFYSRLGGEAVVRLLGDKWLKVPATGKDFESFASFTDMQALLTQILKPDSPTFEKGDVETVDGSEVVGLGDRRGTLYVAVTGDPLPFKIVGPGSRGEISFDGWNRPVELTAPTDAIDVAQLQKVG